MLLSRVNRDEKGCCMPKDFGVNSADAGDPEESPENNGGSRKPRGKEINWREVVSQIQAGNPAGEQTLYAYLHTTPRSLIAGRLSDKSSIDDVLHNAYLHVRQALAKGDVEDPEALMNVVVRRRAWEHNEMRHRDRVRLEDVPSIVLTDGINPEQAFERHQQREMVEQVLQKLSSKEREILTRFYIQEQGAEQIQQEMGLSETQFRLTKSRAKAKVAEAGKKKLESHGKGLMALRALTREPGRER
jgi:RNA polymerase sigma-70 factor, ECF subfamily